MGAFSYHRFIFLLACIDRWKVYNRLVFACTVNTVQNTALLLGFFGSHRFFVCMRRKRTNLTFKTTIIEDTHLTLASIPFKVEANNSLIFFAITNIREKFAEFPFLVIFIFPWVDNNSKSGVKLVRQKARQFSKFHL